MLRVEKANVLYYLSDKKSVEKERKKERKETRKKRRVRSRERGQMVRVTQAVTMDHS